MKSYIPIVVSTKSGRTNGYTRSNSDCGGYKLDPEEEQILKDIEAGKYKTVPRIKQEIEKARMYAKHTVNKVKNINIRLSVRDIEKLKARSIETGLPYQTLAAAVLRQYIDRKISLSL